MQICDAYSNSTFANSGEQLERKCGQIETRDNESSFVFQNNVFFFWRTKITRICNWMFCYRGEARWLTQFNWLLWRIYLENRRTIINGLIAFQYYAVGINWVIQSLLWFFQIKFNWNSLFFILFYLSTDINCVDWHFLHRHWFSQAIWREGCHGNAIYVQHWGCVFSSVHCIVGIAERDSNFCQREGSLWSFCLLFQYGTELGKTAA